MIVHDRLKYLLDYNPETGIFIWKVSRRVRSGDVAGYTNDRGYVLVRVDGKLYKAHRLAWFYVHGVWPDEIDHIHGNRSDNRISQLRDVPHSGNAQNIRAARRDNASGLLGVSLHKASGKYVAQIQLDKKKHYLGLFDTSHLAHQAYIKAKRNLHKFSTI
jgi:hypothetical protein